MQRLVARGDAAAIVAELRVTGASDAALALSASGLAALTSDFNESAATHRVTAGAAGAAEALCEVMLARPANAELQRQGCEALCHLTVYKPQMARVLAAGAVPALVAALRLQADVAMLPVCALFACCRRRRRRRRPPARYQWLWRC